MSRPGRPFTHSDEVRFSDLDVNGHLNNVAFVEFLESARVTYISQLYPQGDPWRTSFRADFEMRVGERLLAEGYSVQVIYDRDDRRPMPIPAALRERLIADGARERPPAP